MLNRAFCSFFWGVSFIGHFLHVEKLKSFKSKPFKNRGWDFRFQHFLLSFSSTLKIQNYKLNQHVLCFSAYFKSFNSVKFFKKFFVNTKNFFNKKKTKKLRTYFTCVSVLCVFSAVFLGF